MIIAAVNSKGGVGKTTLSVHLASWLYQHGWTACLVDCDAQRLSSRWIDSAQPEITAIVTDSPTSIIEQLPRLTADFDAVVVDAPGGLGEITGAILSQADAVLIPTGPSNLDIMALDWATSTVQEIQSHRDGLPQTVIIPVQAVAKRLTTRHLMEKAKGLGFGVTKTVIPYREIYSQVAGLVDRPPKLLWQLGTSKRVRQAALELDTLFQEIFPEACEEDRGKIGGLVAPRITRLKRVENQDEQKLVVND